MNTETIHLVSVEYGKTQNILLFNCYMPNDSMRLHSFEYSGIDITGCIYEGYYLYKGLKAFLNKDFGFAPFIIAEAKKVVPTQYQIVC